MEFDRCDFEGLRLEFSAELVDQGGLEVD